MHHYFCTLTLSKILPGGKSIHIYKERNKEKIKNGALRAPFFLEKGALRAPFTHPMQKMTSLFCTSGKCKFARPFPKNVWVHASRRRRAHFSPTGENLRIGVLKIRNP